MESEIIGKYEITDAHAHIFPDKIAEKATENTGQFYDLPMSDCGMGSRLIESGKKSGVSRYLVCSPATKANQARSINRFIASECKKHPEFIGFGTTHPDSENIEEEIGQIISLGLHGVKLHPDFQQFDADDRKAYKIYEMIEGRLPLLMHCGDPRYDYSAPRKVRKVHDDFPKLRIIAAHLGGYGRWDEAEECLTGLENIKVDICSSMAFMSKERAAQLIREYGVENCFFGTDFPMWSHEEELARFFSLGFSEEENRLILAENFKNFMGI